MRLTQTRLVGLTFRAGLTWPAIEIAVADD